MSWRGGNAFERRLKEAKERLQREVPKAMTKVVIETHNEVMPLTPLDKGPLRETSVSRVGGTVVSQGTQGDNVNQVATVDSMGKTLTGKVAFRTDYAVKVHEIPAQVRTTSGTTHKFLEIASNDRKEANRQIFREVKVFKK